MLTTLLLLFALTQGLQPFLPAATSWSAKRHQSCLRWAPQSPWRGQYQAIVCGSNIKKGHFYQNLQQLGLLHIIVVSGAHLAILIQFTAPLKKYPGFTLLRFLLLLFYTLICRMDPPVVRALFGLFILESNKAYKLQLNRFQIITLAGFACLFLTPNWWQSLSLRMSWTATFGISLFKNVLFQSLCCFILLWPLMLNLTQPSLLSIFVNASLTPIIGIFLFPMSLLCFFIPPITPWVDQLWTLFSFITHKIARIIPTGPPKTHIHISNSVSWFFVFLISFVLIELKRRRKI